MSDCQKIFTPSHPLPAGRTGLLTAFEPGTRTLKAGFQVAPPFRPLPVDIVFEKDVAELFIANGSQRVITTSAA